MEESKKTLGRFEKRLLHIYVFVMQSCTVIVKSSYIILIVVGVCPVEMTRKPVGVFIALSQCENEKFCSRVPFGLIGYVFKNSNKNNFIGLKKRTIVCLILA